MTSIYRCFLHIVNLACHAILKAVTKLKYAAKNAEDYVPKDEDPVPATFKEVLKCDPVATTCSLIQGVSLYITPESAVLSLHRFSHHHSNANIFQTFSRLWEGKIFSYFEMLTHSGHQHWSWWTGLLSYALYVYPCWYSLIPLKLICMLI